MRKHLSFGDVVKTEHKFLMEDLSIHDPKCSNEQIRNMFH